MTAPFALPAAVAFGIADFAGGLAARRAPAVVVTALAQAAGGLILLPALLVLPGTPSVPAAWIGALAGLAGATGLLLYFRALAVGPMGVVAPLSALIGAGLPLVLGIARGERPGPLTLAAFIVALLAIALATAGTRAERAARTGLLLGLGAGAGFGLFFVALDATPPGSGLWPLLAARVASVAVFGVLLWVLGAGVPRTGPACSGATLRLVVLSGALDMAANILFLVATRAGSLATSAVLVSLYPVVVVLLARFVLRERLTPLQLTSVGLALAASSVISATG